MAKPLEIRKLKLSAEKVKALSPEHRSAFLLLGLFLNEANWLRKLLIKSTLNTWSEGPEGPANFSLTMLLTTTLTGKVYEGWDRISDGKLNETLEKLALPDNLKILKAKITARLHGQAESNNSELSAEEERKSKIFLRIRNNIGFHYPEKKFDFSKLGLHLSDEDATIYLNPKGYQGDMLSHISTLAGIEPILALSSETDYREAIKEVWEEVMDVTGLYCYFVFEALGSLVIKLFPHISQEAIIIEDAPNASDDSTRFFIHPPDDLDELIVKAKSKN